MNSEKYRFINMLKEELCFIFFFIQKVCIFFYILKCDQLRYFLYLICLIDNRQNECYYLKFIFKGKILYDENFNIIINCVIVNMKQGIVINVDLLLVIFIIRKFKKFVFDFCRMVIDIYLYIYRFLEIMYFRIIKFGNFGLFFFFRCQRLNGSFLQK